MSESSIIADLRNLAGPIIGKSAAEIYEDEAKEVVTLTPADVNVAPKARGRPRGTKNIQPAAATATGVDETRVKNTSNKELNINITIEHIVELIKHPLKPAIAGEKYIYDVATIVARCDMGHIHKYFIRDIVNNGVLNECITCKAGNMFTTLVRKTIEEILGVPFIYSEHNTLSKKIDGNSPIYNNMNVLEFSNPILRIHVACYAKSKDSGGNLLSDSSAKDGESTLIRIHYTKSKKKINDTLSLVLSPMKELFDPPVRERIEALTPVKKKSPYVKNDLPKIPELAKDLKIAGLIENNIMLCMENCGTDKSE